MKVVVVGGSIAGLACAYALIAAGCQAIVLEKARSLTSAGAGLGLDPETCQALCGWGLHHQLMQTTVPLTIDENRATDSTSKVTRRLARDENLNFRASHWSDLHRLLYDNLPPNTVRWGHEVLSFQQTHNNLGIKVDAKVGQSEEIIEVEGDLLVAADGSMSLIRI
eukprot:Gb_23864 [translate_table: standard]